MDNARKPRKKLVAVLAVLVLFAPFLYVASAGPAAAMVVQDREFFMNGPGLCIYNRAYTPLIAAEVRSQMLHATMDGWRRLFLDETGEQLWWSACSVAHVNRAFKCQ